MSIHAVNVTERRCKPATMGKNAVLQFDDFGSKRPSRGTDSHCTPTILLHT